MSQSNEQLRSTHHVFPHAQSHLNLRPAFTGETNGGSVGARRGAPSESESGGEVPAARSIEVLEKGSDGIGWSLVISHHYLKNTPYSRRSNHPFPVPFWNSRKFT